MLSSRHAPGCLLAGLFGLTLGFAQQPPVAHYHFDGDFLDSSLNLLHGTANGALGFATDRHGGLGMALDITSNSQSVSLPLSPVFDQLGDRFTIAFWVCVQPGAFDGVVFDRDQIGTVSYDWNLGLATKPGAVGLYAYLLIGGNTTYRSNVRLDDGRWHHVVVQRDRQTDLSSGKVRFYVDGRLDVVHSAVTNGLNVSGRTSIGRNNVQMRSLVCHLDDLVLYGTLLGEAEIRLLADQPPENLWTAGTSSRDEFHAMTIGPNGLAVSVGLTEGALSGFTNAGGQDVIVMWWDTRNTSASGPLRVAQIGTAGNEIAYGVTMDPATFEVYVTGFTSGDFGGGNAGGDDRFLAKFDAAGTLLWTRQYGGSGNDFGRNITMHPSGDVLVSGFTPAWPGISPLGGGDFLLARFDARGNQVAANVFGTPAYEDPAHMAYDPINDRVYLTGATFGNCGSWTNQGQDDILVVACDANARYRNCWQWGTPQRDQGIGLTMVPGTTDLVVAILTMGHLYAPPAGHYDVAYARLDMSTTGSGSTVWGTQFGTPARDACFGGLAVRPGFPNVLYGGGETLGAFPGYALQGSQDGILIELDADSGALRFLHQFGTSGLDFFSGPPVVDPYGDVWVVGTAGAALPGQVSLGGLDAFVARYDEAAGLTYDASGCSGASLETRGGYQGYSLRIDMMGNSAAQVGLIALDAYLPGFPMPIAGAFAFPDSCAFHVNPGLSLLMTPGPTPGHFVLDQPLGSSTAFVGVGLVIQGVTVDLSSQQIVSTDAMEVLLR